MSTEPFKLKWNEAAIELLRAEIEKSRRVIARREGLLDGSLDPRENHDPFLGKDLTSPDRRERAEMILARNREYLANAEDTLDLLLTLTDPTYIGPLKQLREERLKSKETDQ